MDGAAPSRPLVILVNGDAAVRRALGFSLQVEGYEVQVCCSAEALLALRLPDRRACLVLDRRLPDISGLEALRILRRRGVGLPVILLVGGLDRRLRAEARAVAAELLEKPLLGFALINAVQRAFAAQGVSAQMA
jgi:two-component system response regulator FixJ